MKKIKYIFVILCVTLILTSFSVPSLALRPPASVCQQFGAEILDNSAHTDARTSSAAQYLLTGVNITRISNHLRKFAQEKAGVIMARFRAMDEIPREIKPDGSIVTIADKQIQDQLIEELIELIPDSVVIGEEGFNAETIKKAKGADYVWIVDPIDGTSAYESKASGEYGMAVTLLYRGRPIYALFYAPGLQIGPHKGCMIEASDTRDGAYLTDLNTGKEVRIRVSDTLEFRDAICNIFDMEEYPEEPFEPGIRNAFGTVVPLVEKFASSARYSMLSASANYNNLPVLYTNRTPCVWDIIPGAYLMKKAGGIVMYADGTSVIPLDFDKLTVSGQLARIPSTIACSLAAKPIILSIGARSSSAGDEISITRTDANNMPHEVPLRDLFLKANAFDYPWIDRIVSTARRENAITFVARNEVEEIVGCVTGAAPGKTDLKKYIFWPDTHYLVGIATDRFYRGKGIGRGLLEKYIQEVKQQGYRYIALHITPTSSKTLSEIIWGFYWYMVVQISEEYNRLPFFKQRGELMLLDLTASEQYPSLGTRSASQETAQSFVATSAINSAA